LITVNGNSTLFSIPNSCPSVVIPVCSNLELTSVPVLEPLCHDLDLDAEGSTSKASNTASTPKQQGKVTPKHKGKGKGKAPLSEANVRRTMHLKLIHKGLKSTSSSCKDKNCLGCLAKPPTISPKVIRNLGASFCGINPAELTPAKLNAKPAAKKKKTVRSKKPASSNQNNEDQAASSRSQSSKNGATDPST
jgi:hypothetical protein